MDFQEQFYRMKSILEERDKKEGDLESPKEEEKDEEHENVHESNGSSSTTDDDKHQYITGIFIAKHKSQFFFFHFQYGSLHAIISRYRVQETAKSKDKEKEVAETGKLVEEQGGQDERKEQEGALMKNFLESEYTSNCDDSVVEPLRRTAQPRLLIRSRCIQDRPIISGYRVQETAKSNEKEKEVAETGKLVEELGGQDERKEQEGALMKSFLESEYASNYDDSVVEPRRRRAQPRLLIRPRLIQDRPIISGYRVQETAKSKEREKEVAETGKLVEGQGGQDECKGQEGALTENNLDSEGTSNCYDYVVEQPRRRAQARILIRPGSIPDRPNSRFKLHY